MVLQIFVDIKRVESLGIKTGKEHTDDQQQIKRLHILPAFFHALVHVVVIGAEIIGREGCAEHRVVVVHDGLQFIGRNLRVGEPLIHSRLFVVLAGVGCIGKDGPNPDLGIQLLEYLVIAEQHRHGLDGKQRVVFAVEG